MTECSYCTKRIRGKRIDAGDGVRNWHPKCYEAYIHNEKVQTYRIREDQLNRSPLTRGDFIDGMNKLAKLIMQHQR